jgi:hypothetical protein
VARSRRLRPDLKTNRARAHAERGESLQDLRHEERELLRPRGRRDVQGEHAPAQATGLGALRDALPDRAPPALAVDDHPACARGGVAGLFQEDTQW